MHADPPNGGDSGELGGGWLEKTIEARKRDLEAAAPPVRVIAAIRFARSLAWSGDDAAAARVLVRERRAQRKKRALEDVARCELGLAEIAILSDDEDRAAVHLESARELAAEDLAACELLFAWIAARRGDSSAASEGPNAPESKWMVELFDAVTLELSWARGSTTPNLQVRGDDARTRALRKVWESTRDGRTKELLDALRALEEGGLARDFGRSVLRVLGAAPHLLSTADENATQWVARAQLALGESQTWRDRANVRHAWRTHGRRDVDKAIPRDVAARLDARDRMRAHVASSLAIGLDRQHRALEELESAQRTQNSGALEGVRESVDLLEAGAEGALSEFARVEGDLANVVAATFADRERARSIATVLAALETTPDSETLARKLAAVARDQLNASAVIVAERFSDIGWRPIAACGGEPSDGWAELAEKALEAPSQESPSLAPDVDRRGGRDVPPCGPVLVVPMRASGAEGVLFAEKRPPGTAFTANDRATLELIAAHGAWSISRLRALEDSRRAAEELGEAVAGMTDALVSVDADGVVTAVNDAAARLLRVETSHLLQRRIEEIPELGPLADVLSWRASASAVVVRLAHASLVAQVRARTGRGVVATLVELENAQKSAQKLLGGRTQASFADVHGHDPQLLEAVEAARRAASIDADVLLIGERGTGKKLLAQAIHGSSARAREAFVVFDLSRTSRASLELELFGCEPDAFTGARADGCMGKLELAGEGTILLDEIHELPLDLQAQLLRVLQTRTVVRVGSEVERPMHARVLATSSRDLVRDLENGRFRGDLLQHLRVLRIALPPLRHRIGDIGDLARHFVRQSAERQRKAVRDVASAVEQQLMTHRWPGNVRELSMAIDDEVSLLAPNVRVLNRVPASVSHALAEGPGPLSTSSGAFPVRSSSHTGETDAISARPVGEEGVVPLVEIERRAYLDAYERCNRSVSRAAKALGVSKVTFYAKLRQCGMHPAETGETPSARTTGEHAAVRTSTGEAETVPTSGAVKKPKPPDEAPMRRGRR